MIDWITDGEMAINSSNDIIARARRATANARRDTLAELAAAPPGKPRPAGRNLAQQPRAFDPEWIRQQTQKPVEAKPPEVPSWMLHTTVKPPRRRDTFDLAAIAQAATATGRLH